MTLTQRNAIASPATGLMIYQTNSTPGFYYYTGTAWKDVTTKAGWSLTGNAGTNSSTNFIGTTDAQPLVFKVSNTQAGYLDPSFLTSNTSFGYQSMFTKVGNSNVAFGFAALHSDSSGNYNSANGYYALYSNKTGSSNVAAGFQSLTSNTSGNYNTATGWETLAYNTTGADNTATGTGSLEFNNGNENTATGAEALHENTMGALNVSNGYESMLLNTKGGYNSVNGAESMYNNTTGNNNTANGFESLYTNNDGVSNAANGYQSMYSNTSGYQNAALGSRSMYSNTTGGYNLAAGVDALYYNTTGFSNTATGQRSLYANNTGNTNTATGFNALYLNTTGNDNTGDGTYALFSNNTGHSNVAVGKSSLYSSTAGSNLVAIGDSALFSISGGGHGSVAVGSKAGYGDTAGSFNSYFGSHAGYYENTSENTEVGYSAGWSANGYGCTYVGYAAGPTIPGLYNTTGIGFDVTPMASNQVLIGNGDVTSIGGQVGWTTFSDGRYKKNIKENVPGLAFINQLKPVTYTVDITDFARSKGENKKAISGNSKNTNDNSLQEKIIHTGFIAQDVDAVAKKLNYDFDGVDAPKNDKDYYGLRYGEFVVPLVKAVQELSSQNDSLKKQNADLQKQFDELKTLVLSIQQLQQQCSPCSAASSQTVPGSNIILTDQSSLEQNIPNPFSQTTIINYILPQKYSNAFIVITDKDGKTLRQANIFGSGKGSLTVDASVLSSGAYNYSLYVEGKLIATKQMALAK
jgi:hypothetical protein